MFRARRVRTVAEILADPHFRERGTLRPMRNAAVAGEIVAGGGDGHGDGDVAEVVVGFPVLFDGRALPDVAGAPALGQHNAGVLGELCGVDAGSWSGCGRTGWSEKIVADGYLLGRQQSTLQRGCQDPSARRLIL